MVTTNGLLLHRMDDTFCAALTLSGNRVSGYLFGTTTRRGERQSSEFDTELWLFPMNHFRTTIVTEPIQTIGSRAPFS